MSEITSVEIDRTEGIDSKVSIRSSGVEELKRFACKIERRGGKGKKGIADEKTLFVSKVAGNFFQLPFEREKDPPRGGERGERTISISSTAELHTGGSSDGTRHGERSFEDRIPIKSISNTLSREI